MHISDVILATGNLAWNALTTEERFDLFQIGVWEWEWILKWAAVRKTNLWKQLGKWTPFTFRLHYWFPWILNHASSWNNVKFWSTVRQTHLNLSRCLSNPELTTQMKSPEKSEPFTHESKVLAELVNTWKSCMTPWHHILSEYLHDLNLGFFATRTSDSFLTTSSRFKLPNFRSHPASHCSWEQNKFSIWD